MKKQHIEKIQTLLEPDLSKLEGDLILPTGESYCVFSQYQIVPAHNTFAVYRHCSLQHRFSKVRYALSYCIAEKHNKIELAKDIRNLDSDLQRMHSNLHADTVAYRRCQDPVRRCILEDKMCHTRSKKIQIENRLKKCVDLAKYFQLRGFNHHETARSRNTASLRAGL